MKIKITRKHDFHEGKTKSAMDILFEDFGISVSGVKAIETDRGIFFAMPSNSFDGRDGKKAYKSIVSCPIKEDYYRFQSAMKEAYANYDSTPLPPKDEIVESTGSGYHTPQGTVHQATPQDHKPSVTFGDSENLPF